MGEKINTFVYCLATERRQEPNGLITAIGILPIITPEFLPSAFSFSIVFQIAGMDTSVNHMLSIELCDNNDRILVQKDGIYIPSNKEDDANDRLPDDAKGALLSMEFKNVLLMEEGRYYTKVKLDEKQLGEYEIYVKSKSGNVK